VPTFAPVVPYQTGGNAQGIVSADSNGDGRPDLAIANSQTNTVGILLQAGPAGTFMAPTSYSTGGSFSPRLATGDLNRDGRPDLVVVNQGSNTMSVLLSSPTSAALAGAVIYPTNGVSPRGVAIADVNADGRPDVVVANRDGGGIGVLLNSATNPGTLTTGVSYEASLKLDVLVLGDLNGDNLPDIAAAVDSGSMVAVLLNSAITPGTFGPAIMYGASGKGTNTGGLAVGDLNNDGLLDLVASNNVNFNAVEVLLNSTATPGTFPVIANYSTGSTIAPSGVTIGDLTGDGRADIVASTGATGFMGNTVSILVNSSTASGTFTAPPVIQASGGSGPLNAVVRDLNADGVPDLAITNFGSSNVGVLLNTTFLKPVLTSTTTPASQQVALYPNPAQTSAFLELPASLGSRVVAATLLDALGRPVRTMQLPAQGSGAHSLDLRGLPSGVYALRLNTTAGTIVKQLAVN